MADAQTEMTSLLGAEESSGEATSTSETSETPPAEKTEETPAAKPEEKVDAKPDDKPAEKTEKKDGETPPALELKLPEDMQFEPASIEAFKAIASEAKLAPEVAQKIVDGHVAALKASAEKANALFEAEQKAWQESLKADAEIGGEHFEANVSHAKRAVAKFGGSELAGLLRESGLGNHPLLVKAFVKIGKAMSEDSVAGSRSSPSTAAGDPLVSLYTTLSKE